MKSKKSLFLFAIGGIALVFASVCLIAGRAGRTRSYFAAFRTSYDHAPAAGRSVLALADFVLNPVFEIFGPFEPVWVQVQPGIKMQLDPYDFVSRKLLETGEWESESVRAVADHLSPSGTFIDIGAHIGYYSLKAATLVGPNGHVISVEPNPQTLPKLRSNIQANIETNTAQMVSVWPVACAQSESTLQFFAAPESNTGESSLSKENASQEGAAPVPYEVRARPLDAIVKEAKLDRVDVIKIDVEGAELQVLKGAAQTLDDYRPVIVIELIPNQLQAMGTSMEEVTKFLASHGYTMDRQMGNANYEFVPPEDGVRASAVALLFRTCPAAPSGRHAAGFMGILYVIGTIKTMTRKASVVIEKDENGFFAWCPELKGCQTEGRTMEEALANIREAIELYLETLNEEERAAAFSQEIVTTAIEVHA